MRFKSGLFTLTLFLCGTLLFCGCSQSSSDGANAPSGAHDSAAAQARVVVDAYGRSVKLPADVQSAVAVGSAARIVTYAGGQDKLIGVGELDKSAQTTMPYTIAEVATFKDLPVTNNGNHLFPLEADVQSIRDLHPDVIISSGSAEECDTLQEETGIPVVGVFYQNQLFSEGIINSIDCVGEALGSESHAQSVIAKIQGWSDDLSERTKGRGTDESPLVYFGAVPYMGDHGWEGTYANYAPAIAAHVRNAANMVGSNGYIEVAFNQIAEWDPAIVFINTSDLATLVQEYEDNQELFDSITAIRDNKVYTQPFYNSNGTNVETGICEAYFVGATVYPDAFADVDLDALYTDIFETMLDGFDFYSYMKEQGRYFGQFPFAQER